MAVKADAKTEKSNEVVNSGEKTGFEKQRAFRTIATNFLKLENEGDSVEGKLIERSTQQFPNGIVGRYKLMDDAGKVVTLLGATGLDDLLSEAAVPVGVYVRIKLNGWQRTNQGRRMKMFSVDVAE